jgi:hypothetical protein
LGRKVGWQFERDQSQWDLFDAADFDFGVRE